MSNDIQWTGRIPEEWREGADELDVPLTEYVRMMVRAGRRDWGFEHVEEPDRPHVNVEEQTPGTDEGIDTIIKDAIVRNLSTDEGTSEEELVSILLQDLESQTGRLLNELSEEDAVQYDPVKGGWVKE